MVLSIAKVWGKQETSFEIDKGLSLFIQLRALAALEGLWRGRGYGGASQREAAAVGGVPPDPSRRTLFPDRGGGSGIHNSDGFCSCQAAHFPASQARKS